MAVLQWNPWTELETFTHELHHLFDISLSRPLSNGHHTSWQPRVDFHETATDYVLEADLPGMTIENITVQLDGTTLTIAGERQRAHNGAAMRATHTERTFGPFRRSLTLPTAVQREAVQATYTHGVLTVTVPKAEAARPRQITVQAA